ncbi:MAG: hypothetical protein HOV81_28955 [Kofleriaceae bacterium]|nr:hypothetical protein [Kofleriaceae bacterium]
MTWQQLTLSRLARFTLLVIAGIVGCSSKPSDPLGQIEVKLESSGEGMWNITVANHHAAAVKILWDESSYVGTDGKSRGRLVRGETRRIDVGKPQPPTPVAPNATIEESVIPESYASDVRASFEPDEKGTMYLVIESSTGKHTWHGVSVPHPGTIPIPAADPKDDPPAPDPKSIPLTSGFYCTTPKIPGADEFCSRVLEYCENGRATGARSVSKPGPIDEVMNPCTKVETALCFDFTPKSIAGKTFEPIEECSVSSAACTRTRKVLASTGTVTKCAERK